MDATSEILKAHRMLARQLGDFLPRGHTDAENAALVLPCQTLLVLVAWLRLMQVRHPPAAPRRPRSLVALHSSSTVAIVVLIACRSMSSAAPRRPLLFVARRFSSPPLHVVSCDVGVRSGAVEELMALSTAPEMDVCVWSCPVVTYLVSRCIESVGCTVGPPGRGTII